MDEQPCLVKEEQVGQGRRTLVWRAAVPAGCPCGRSLVALKELKPGENVELRAPRLQDEINVMK